MVKRSRTAELDAPPIAVSNSEAVEELRVWAAPGAPQQFTFRPTWKDSGAWGLMLVDIARHAALAYERDGFNHDDVLRRIRELFDAEWASPTSPAEEVKDR